MDSSTEPFLPDSGRYGPYIVMIVILLHIQVIRRAHRLVIFFNSSNHISISHLIDATRLNGHHHVHPRKAKRKQSYQCATVYGLVWQSKPRIVKPCYAPTKRNHPNQQYANRLPQGFLRAKPPPTGGGCLSAWQRRGCGGYVSNIDASVRGVNAKRVALNKHKEHLLTTHIPLLSYTLRSSFSCVIQLRTLNMNLA